MADATPTGTSGSSELELPAHWLITGASSGARLVVERLDVSDADELCGLLGRILEGHDRIEVIGSKDPWRCG